MPQPLHTSSWTTTVPNSVRNSAPVGHTSRHAAVVQCLHTSEAISQRSPSSPSAATGRRCSMNATWRQVSEPRRAVLSYDSALKPKSSVGSSFHSLQATSHALQPMHSDVSVKKPIRGRASSP
jgi:hypothetical protein